LGVNCGLGNSDCSRLEFRHLNLASGWLTFPRPKTGVKRRCRLWAETVTALREAIAARPTPKSAEDAELVLLTRCGQPWVKLNASGTPADALGQEFKKLLVDQKLWREGLGFYALRHCTETIGGNCKDQVATSHVMGHKDGSMAGHYREKVDDGRLEAVAATIHDWLYPPEEKPAAKPRAKRKPKQETERVAWRVVG
jgi:integrase